jgi:hypothetical protein
MKKARYISALLACILISVSTHAVKIRREPGQRLPEYIQPTDLDDPALWLRPTGSVFTRAIAAPGDYSLNDIPRTGTIDYPLVLVDFSDLRFMIQDKDSLVRRYDRLFNEHGYTDTTSYFSTESGFMEPPAAYRTISETSHTVSSFQGSISSAPYI